MSLETTTNMTLALNCNRRVIASCRSEGGFVPHSRFSPAWQPGASATLPRTRGRAERKKRGGKANRQARAGSGACSEQNHDDLGVAVCGTVAPHRRDVRQGCRGPRRPLRSSSNGARPTQ
eukprot:3391553-Pyramimonas_sp.AAC.1